MGSRRANCTKLMIVYITSLLATPLARSLTNKSLLDDGPSPIFCISINDIDWVEKLHGGFVATTSDRIFESKHSLFDMFVQLPFSTPTNSPPGSTTSSSFSFASTTAKRRTSSLRTRFSFSRKPTVNIHPLFTAANTASGESVQIKANYIDQRRYKKTLRKIMFPDGDDEEEDSLHKAGFLRTTASTLRDWWGEIADWTYDNCSCGGGCSTFGLCSGRGISIDDLDTDSVRRGANGFMTRVKGGAREGRERLSKLWRRTQKRYRILHDRENAAEYESLYQEEDEQDDLGGGRRSLGYDTAVSDDLVDVNGAYADRASIRSGRSQGGSIRSGRSARQGSISDSVIVDMPSSNNGDSVEIELIGYFHNLTFNLLTTLRSILTSTASFHNADEPVLLSPEHFTLLGLDPRADADFVVQLAKIYFDKDVRVTTSGSYSYSKHAAGGRLKRSYEILRAIGAKIIGGVDSCF